jgi:WD40 repeat protein
VHEEFSMDLDEHCWTRSVNVSNDLKYLVSASAKGNLKIFDYKTQSLIADKVKYHSSDIFCVEFAPDNRTIATSSGDRRIQVFNIPENK